MALNRDLVVSRFDDIRQSLDRLASIAQVPREDFLRNQDLMDIASYRLLVAIESAIQLCYHVSAHRAHRAPESYAACFALLSEAGIVPDGLSRRLQQMARFRNMLVHVYWDVDYNRVYDVLQENLDDLRGFVSAVGDAL